MKIRFLEVAETELDDAVNFYNRESPGLGDRFLAEILDVLDRVAQFPSAWHPCSKRTRRCRTKRFPYGVIYRPDGDEILVVAVANLHREPEYWEDRLQK